MTTYRERRLAKAERLREWAHKRRVKADAVFKSHEPFTSDLAFNTQPGHFPLRARIIRQEDREVASLNKAADMESRAAGIEAAAERAIYSDDENALDALQARITEREALADKYVEGNKAFKKGGIEALVPLFGQEATLKVAAEMARAPWQKRPFTYHLTNLRNLIRSDRERLKAIEARQARAAAADANGGVVVQGDAFVSVTFSEKPAREILDALRAAGFHWSKGSWYGYRDKLPEGGFAVTTATATGIGVLIRNDGDAPVWRARCGCGYRSSQQTYGVALLLHDAHRWQTGGRGFLLHVPTNTRVDVADP
jgi:hypothetical protein